ncbi:MAG: right-handed parallel beta-helix repeat-containing protein [Pseudomonadota bacterium]
MRFVFVLLACVATLPGTAKEVLVPAEPGALSAALEAGGIAAGDVVMLAPGHHGAVHLRGYRFDPPIVVRPASGTVTISELTLRDLTGWRLEGLRVRPDALGTGPLVQVRQGRDVWISGFDIASGEAPERWRRSDWLERARSGIETSGRDIRLIGNTLRGVDHGIGAASDRTRVEGNRISWFAGDGIRALGNDNVYRGNTIQTCVAVDNNHDDGIQSWSRGPDGRPGTGTVRNVVVEGNMIRNGDAGRGLTCALQGIGLFDGMFENWIIRRNVVIVDHWHGITVMGARDVTIRGNLVVDADPDTLMRPWISITAHKDGRLSQGGVIAENISQQMPAAGHPRFRQPQPGVRVSGERNVPSAQVGIRLWNEEN